jgi:hypothetical protein
VKEDIEAASELLMFMKMDSSDAGSKFTATITCKHYQVGSEGSMSKVQGNHKEEES